MQAAYIERLGPPEEIRVGELPDPRPGPTDVLLDVLATTVNPVDTFVRSGVFATPMSFPFVVGRDVVGRVRDAGAGAVGVGRGDLVWSNSLGYAGRQGAAAERAVVGIDRCYPLPAGVHPHAAVSLVHPAATAYLALFVHGGLRAGKTVLVVGAGGNVGRALVSVAVDAGARVLAVAAERDLELCRDLGAEHALPYAVQDTANALHRLAPGGVDVHVDTSGHNDLEPAVELLAPRGRIVLLAGAATTTALPVGRLYTKDGSIRGFVISRASSAELADAAGAINRLLVTGALRPGPLEVRSLGETADTHRRLEQGELHGRRVVLRPDPVPARRAAPP